MWHRRGFFSFIILVSLVNFSVFPQQSTQTVAKNFAGKIPQEAFLEITGNPIPSEFLKQAVAQSLREIIVPQKKVSLNFKIPRKLLPPSFQEGDAFTLQIPVAVTGKGYIPVKGNVRFHIETKSFSIPPTKTLLVSNNPENFSSPGTLFEEKLSEGGAIRLFFHHRNSGEIPYLFHIFLRNDFSEAARFHILQAGSHVAVHELQAGVVATARFLTAFRDHVGRMMNLRPQSAAPLFSRKVPPGDTISGILELTPLSSGNISLVGKVESVKEGKSETALPSEDGKIRGIFSNPDLVLHEEYLVGGHYTFITLGKFSSLQDSRTHQYDSGNYGALYTIHLRAKNPLPTHQNAHIVFTPQGGPAAGAFLINGETLVVTPVVPAFAYYPIWNIGLNPGEIKTVMIQTIPEGGSFYPVHLVVRP